jgi:hypothetical protein
VEAGGTLDALDDEALVETSESPEISDGWNSLSAITHTKPLSHAFFLYSYYHLYTIGCNSVATSL